MDILWIYGFMDIWIFYGFMDVWKYGYFMDLWICGYFIDLKFWKIMDMAWIWSSMRWIIDWICNRIAIHPAPLPTMQL